MKCDFVLKLATIVRLEIDQYGDEDFEVVSYEVIEAMPISDVKDLKKFITRKQKEYIMKELNRENK